MLQGIINTLCPLVFIKIQYWEVLMLRQFRAPSLVVYIEYLKVHHDGSELCTRKPRWDHLVIPLFGMPWKQIGNAVLTWPFKSIYIYVYVHTYIYVHMHTHIYRHLLMLAWSLIRAKGSDSMLLCCFVLDFWRLRVYFCYYQLTPFFL